MLRLDRANEFVKVSSNILVVNQVQCVYVLDIGRFKVMDLFSTALTMPAVIAHNYCFKGSNFYLSPANFPERTIVPVHSHPRQP